MRLFLTLVLGASVLSGCTRAFWTAPSKRARTLKNYGPEALAEAEAEGLPYAYLMALITLECSGQRPCPSRKEPGRFGDLRDVRDGLSTRLENIRARDVHDASDEALWNLATSWGPFQVMGYKCIGLGVQVADIRGERSLHHGTRWIAQDYGHLLRAERYKDAFHWHNAGSTYPKTGGPRTYDPAYVDNGLDHMAWFEQHPPH
jgi:hypothetical protein